MGKASQVHPGPFAPVTLRPAIVAFPSRSGGNAAQANGKPAQSIGDFGTGLVHRERILAALKSTRVCEQGTHC